MLGFFEGGVEVPILFLWAWGFFRTFAARTAKITDRNCLVSAIHQTIFGDGWLDMKVQNYRHPVYQPEVVLGIV